MQDNEANPAPPNVTPVLMSPFMAGNMWGQKFSGKNPDVRLPEWQTNLKTMFSMFNLAAYAQTDMVLNSLEGEAKRHILLLEQGDRTTVEQIFSVLNDLYGNRMPTSSLRSMCFSCKQEPAETVMEFSLRLQELFQKLKKRDPDGMGPFDRLLRDQFVDGLSDRTLRRELKTLTRSSPTLSFAEINKEARLRGQADGEELTAFCHQAGRPTPPAQAQLDMEKLKKELREEMAAEIKNQMLPSPARQIAQERRAELNPGGQDRSRQGQSREYGQQSRYRQRPRNQGTVGARPTTANPLRPDTRPSMDNRRRSTEAATSQASPQAQRSQAWTPQAARRHCAGAESHGQEVPAGRSPQPCAPSWNRMATRNPVGEIGQMLFAFLFLFMFLIVFLG